MKALYIILVVFSASSVGVISAASVLSDNNLPQDMASRADIADNIITDTPLSESIQIIKALDVSASDVISAEKDITLDATVDNFVVSFVAKNNAGVPVSLDADTWYYRIITPIDETTNPISDAKFVVPQNGSLELARVDLSEYQNLFEDFPGVYTVELVGSKWQEKDFGKYTKAGNFANYHIRVNVKIDYDIDTIKAQPNKLLKADSMLLGIENKPNTVCKGYVCVAAPEDSPYVIQSNNPKRIDFYIVNDGSEKISSMISGFRFEVWNSESRFPSVGSSMKAELIPDSCQFLNPGEKKLVDSFILSKEGWPIGKDGLADLAKNEDLSGIYIAKMSVITAPCESEFGEKIPSSVHSMTMALEVKP